MATATSKPMGDYTIIARDDGSKQWAYKGRPLYTTRSPATSPATVFSTVPGTSLNPNRRTVFFD